MRKSVLAALTVTLMATGSTGFTLEIANAQSFSCSNAQIPSEMAICNNENLLLKDEELAALFANAIIQATASGKIDDVSSEHIDWLKKRNACKIDFDCLEKSYSQRINALDTTDEPVKAKNAAYGAVTY